jgi:hypothetical protein
MKEQIGQTMFDENGSVTDFPKTVYLVGNKLEAMDCQGEGTDVFTARAYIEHIDPPNPAQFLLGQLLGETETVVDSWRGGVAAPEIATLTVKTHNPWEVRMLDFPKAKEQHHTTHEMLARYNLVHLHADYGERHVGTSPPNFTFATGMGESPPAPSAAGVVTPPHFYPSGFWDVFTYPELPAMPSNPFPFSGIGLHHSPHESERLSVFFFALVRGARDLPLAAPGAMPQTVPWQMRPKLSLEREFAQQGIPRVECLPYTREIEHEDTPDETVSPPPTPRPTPSSAPPMTAPPPMPPPPAPPGRTALGVSLPGSASNSAIGCLPGGTPAMVPPELVFREALIFWTDDEVIVQFATPGREAYLTGTPYFSVGYIAFFQFESGTIYRPFVDLERGRISASMSLRDANGARIVSGYQVSGSTTPDSVELRWRNPPRPVEGVTRAGVGVNYARNSAQDFACYRVGVGPDMWVPQIPVRVITPP